MTNQYFFTLTTLCVLAMSLAQAHETLSLRGGQRALTLTNGFNPSTYYYSNFYNRLGTSSCAHWTMPSPLPPKTDTWAVMDCTMESAGIPSYYYMTQTQTTTTGTITVEALSYQPVESSLSVDLGLGKQCNTYDNLGRPTPCQFCTPTLGAPYAIQSNTFTNNQCENLLSPTVITYDRLIANLTNAATQHPQTTCTQHSNYQLDCTSTKNGNTYQVVGALGTFPNSATTYVKLQSVKFDIQYLASLGGQGVTVTISFQSDGITPLQCSAVSTHGNDISCQLCIPPTAKDDIFFNFNHEGCADLYTIMT